jgi:DNA-binding transcriptional regulator YhcF (GntR family)
VAGVIELDASSGTPPFEQIRARVSALVEDGTLRSGDRLPTVRGLAEELGLAVNTVARAYRELERSGVIETRGRSGSFVTGDEVTARAKAAATAYLEETRSLGLDPAAAIDLLAQVSRGVR